MELGSGPKQLRWAFVMILLLPLASMACGGEGPGPRDPLLAPLMDAEDARGTGTTGLASILEGLSAPDANTQVVAVRALGRLENREHIGLIAPLLSAQDSNVRTEAVNALGQAVFAATGSAVQSLLLQALPSETDPLVRGVMGRTLGRLRYEDPAEIEMAEEILFELTSQDSDQAPIPTLLGAVMGLEWLTRQNRRMELTEGTKERLQELTSFGMEADRGEADASKAASTRRVALMALLNAGVFPAETILNGMNDPDPDMRRLAISALRGNPSADPDLHALMSALEDEVPRVRAQAVVTGARIAPDTQRCGILQEATSDDHPQVATAALDLLSAPCPDVRGQIATLTAFLRDADPTSLTHWHRGAHALQALSAVSPTTAAVFLSTFANHASPFARAYAARAAGQVGDEAILERLVGDEDPNVRTAGTEALFALRGHAMDALLLEQLHQDEPQLLMTAAGLLEGTPNPADAIAPLLETLERISASGRETNRDPRVAILRRLSEVADEDALARMESYLSDYDPAVAELVAEILTTRTGETVHASPKPAPRVPFPSQDELEHLDRSRVILEMEGGGTIEILLFPYLAPTNTARFARLAESGVFDGLTFHRVVSNFVVQGMSPNANEMAGHGPFTRDEIGLQSNWRGTVGTSTRGRDTGDGQIFINLIDNLRLDHNYTIFGEVATGMDVVDDIVEGQRVLRALVEAR
jgi:cyclophilin family peptidyl-prolyl cis-trans isomerase/HEAT repeat protein